MAFSYWFINTPGIGGLIVITVFMILLLVFARVLLWIRGSGETVVVGGESDAER